MRAMKITGATVAAVLVILVLLLIVGIPSGFLTSAIQAQVERATGYRLTIAGTTRIGLWPSLNVTLNEITLKDPKDRDTSGRLTIESVQADITLSSAWSGHPQISELTITRPVLFMPLLRERIRDNAASSKPAFAGDMDGLAIDRITIADGALVFSNLRDRIENRIDGINATAAIGADRKVSLHGNARAGGEALKFDIKAAVPPAPVDRQNIPVEFTLDAPAMLQAPLSGKAEVRLNGSVVMINGLSGTLGDGAFNGWASIDISSKPLVKLDLDFQRLDASASKAQTVAGLASLEQRPDRSERTELCRRPGQDFRSRSQFRASPIRAGRGRLRARRRRAEGRRRQSRRLWRRAQRRSHHRCVEERPDLRDAR